VFGQFFEKPRQAQAPNLQALQQAIVGASTPEQRANVAFAAENEIARYLVEGEGAPSTEAWRAAREWRKAVMPDDPKPTTESDVDRRIERTLAPLELRFKKAQNDYNEFMAGLSRQFIMPGTDEHTKAISSSPEVAAYRQASEDYQNALQRVSQQYGTDVVAARMGAAPAQPQPAPPATPQQTQPSVDDLLAKFFTENPKATDAEAEAYLARVLGGG